MKLYATVTSERASKGQGGNQFLEIAFKVGDRENVFGSLFIQEDGELELKNSKGIIVLNMNAVEFQETKGNKQKGETCEKCRGQYEGNCAYCMARIAR